MPAAPVYALVHQFGDSFEGVAFVWRDSSGAPKPITGWLASMMVRDVDGVLLLHLDSDSQGGLQVDGPNGGVLISASAAKMKSGKLAPGNHFYDLQVKSPDALTVQTLVRGDFRCDSEVTNV